MSTGNAKDIRKQLRNVIQENIAEILTHELAEGIRAHLAKDIRASLETIDANIRANLLRIEERSRDVQTYMMNTIQAANARASTEDTAPPSSEANVLKPQE
jgi:hypothetical protein